MTEPASDPTLPRAPEPAPEAVAVVERYYAGLAAGAIDAVLAVVDADAVLREPASLPYAGEHRGHAAWQAFGAAFNAAWADPRVTLESAHEAGDVVVGRARLQATARATGRAIDMPLVELFTVRGGRIVELLPFYWDTGEAARALGAAGAGPAGAGG